MGLITRGTEFIAKKAISNQSRIIETSPLSIDIEIYHVTNANNLFGYEAESLSPPVKSKAIFQFSPEKSFLKANGFFLEEGSDLPIIMWAKYEDNIKKLDRIKILMKDDYTDYSEWLQVTNIRTKGIGIFTHNKLYWLAPFRGGVN